MSLPQPPLWSLPGRELRATSAVTGMMLRRDAMFDASDYERNVKYDLARRIATELLGEPQVFTITENPYLDQREFSMRVRVVSDNEMRKALDVAFIAGRNSVKNYTKASVNEAFAAGVECRQTMNDYDYKGVIK